jgi:hypothetical protein
VTDSRYCRSIADRGAPRLRASHTWRARFLRSGVVNSLYGKLVFTITDSLPAPVTGAVVSFA